MAEDFPEVVFDFEKLDVYKETEKAVARILESLSRWPVKYRWLTAQMGSAAASVQLNIAEGNGRETAADKSHFMRIAQGSVNECVANLSMARRLGLMDDEAVREIRSRFHRVVQMLSALIRKLKGGDSKKMGFSES